MSGLLFYIDEVTYKPNVGKIKQAPGVLSQQAPLSEKRASTMDVMKSIASIRNGTRDHSTDALENELGGVMSALAVEVHLQTKSSDVSSCR